MRKTILILAVVLTLSFVFTGCKPSEEDLRNEALQIAMEYTKLSENDIVKSEVIDEEAPMYTVEFTTSNKKMHVIIDMEEKSVMQYTEEKF